MTGITVEPPASMSTVHAPRLPRRNGLDGIRAVAVMAVLVFHGGVDLLPGGFLGVDVFFVLSGFLITSLLLAEVDGSGRVDLGTFWVRRFRRLLPALLFVLVGVAAYAAVIAEPSTLESIRWDSLAALFYVANWRFIWSGASYFEMIAAPSPVRHLWSLAVEEQWYLVWPFVCAVALARPRGRRALGVIVAAGTVTSIVLMSLLTPAVGDPSRAYYGTDTRSQALFIGSGLALVLWRFTSSPTPSNSAGARTLAGVGSVAAATLLVAAFVVVDEGDRWMYRGGFAAVALMAAGLIAGVILAPRVDTSLGIAPLRWVGSRSYAIYLWHWPIVLTLSVSRLGFGGWPRFVVIVVVTLVLAELSYRLVEQPIRTGRVGLAHPIRAAGLGSGMVAVILLAATAGATAPPDYSVVTGDSPDVLEPTGVPSGSETDGGAARHPPQRVVLIGDSIAFSLQEALGLHLVDRGITFANYAVPGCGVVSGTPVAADGSLIENCRVIEERQIAAVDEVSPDVVVIYSAWETSDRVVDGVLYEQGTPEFAEALGALYDETLERVGRDGARAVFVLQVPSADGAATARDPDHDRQLHDINRVMVDAARRRPGEVTVISIHDVVCPSDPCPNTVDGASYRSVDGSHFEMPDAAPVAEALAERIAALDLDALPEP